MRRPPTRLRRYSIAILLCVGTLAAIGVWGIRDHLLGGNEAATPASSSAPPNSADPEDSPDPKGSPDPKASGDEGGPKGGTELPPAPKLLPGFLLIADRGNDRMLLVDQAKHLLWRYPPFGFPPSMPFNFDDDTFFSPDHRSIISNQEEQQTLQQISFPGGKILWSYGHVNVPGSSPGYLYTPDDAYLLPDGNRVVADVHNCRILFISPAHRVVKQYGTTGVCEHAPPLRLNKPNGDTPTPNGGLLVTEIVGSWVDAIGPRGHLMWAVHAPVAYPSDAQWLGPGRILLADYSSPGHVLIMRKDGTVLWRYGPASGPGALDHPSLALMLPNGLIAVNDDYRHRVILIDRRTKRIVWQYGVTDRAAAGRGLLNTPDGMDFLPWRVAMQSRAIRRVVLHPSRG